MKIFSLIFPSVFASFPVRQFTPNQLFVERVRLLISKVKPGGLSGNAPKRQLIHVHKEDPIDLQVDDLSPFIRIEAIQEIQ